MLSSREKLPIAPHATEFKKKFFFFPPPPPPPPHVDKPSQLWRAPLVDMCIPTVDLRSAMCTAGQSVQWLGSNGDAAFPIIREHNSQVGLDAHLRRRACRKTVAMTFAGARVRKDHLAARREPVVHTGALRRRGGVTQTESVGRTDRGDVGTNTELHSEALSLSSTTGPPDIDEITSQTDKWSILNDEVQPLAHVPTVLAQSLVCRNARMCQLI